QGAEYAALLFAIAALVTSQVVTSPLLSQRLDELSLAGFLVGGALVAGRLRSEGRRHDSRVIFLLPVAAGIGYLLKLIDPSLGFIAVIIAAPLVLAELWILR